MNPRHLLLSALLLLPTTQAHAIKFFGRSLSLFGRSSSTAPHANKPPAGAPKTFTGKPKAATPKPGQLLITHAPEKGEAQAHVEHAPSYLAQDHVVESLETSYHVLSSISSKGKAINHAVTVYRDAMKIADAASKALEHASPEEVPTLRLRALAAYSVAQRAANLRWSYGQNAGLHAMNSGSEQARGDRIAKRLGVRTHMLESAYAQEAAAAGQIDIAAPAGQTAGAGSTGNNHAADIARGTMLPGSFRTPFQENMGIIR